MGLAPALLAVHVGCSSPAVHAAADGTAHPGAGGACQFEVYYYTCDALFPTGRVASLHCTGGHRATLLAYGLGDAGAGVVGAWLVA